MDLNDCVHEPLTSSLLTAFGALLGMQWLGHFKTSYFERGHCMSAASGDMDGLES